jgi:two-component system sensor histidine kinase KdpD
MSPGRPIQFKPYVSSAAVTALSTFVASFMFGHFALADLIMVYLLGVVLVSTRFGLRASIAAAAMSVLAFDFFFVPPYLTFAVADTSHVITFGVMFVVAVVIGGLSDRLRQQREAATLREHRTSALYALSRELGSPRDRDDLCRVAAQHFAQAFHCNVAIFLAQIDGKLGEPWRGPHAFEPSPREENVARWVWSHHRTAGRGTDTSSDADAFYLPLAGSREFVGVLGALPSDASSLFDEDQENLLETFARLTASALERAMLADQAQRAELAMEAERLRSNLLSSVSHDLRTPLSPIEGAATTILQTKDRLTEEARSELTRAIVDEARRLGRLVRNLLDMTRLESGEIRLQRQPEAIEEIIGATLTRLEKQLSGRPIRTKVPDDLPLVSLDIVSIGQVLTNLLENAIRYTPDGTPIDVSARTEDDSVVVEVADSGPGLPEGAEQQVFEKFFRGDRQAKDGSVGLGLTICRSIVAAHGGRIWAENRPTGGTLFGFSLPLRGNQPVNRPEPRLGLRT